MEYFVRAIPVFILLILVEGIYGLATGRQFYRTPDSISNLNCGILMQLVGVFGQALMGAGYVIVYHFRQWDILPSPLSWFAVIIGVDFFYYWFHRVSHRSLFFWATHVVHHQSEEYNLSVALRQSALGGFTSWIFYLPLALAGFPPEMALISYSVNLLYQFWIHTRVIGRMGPLEWIWNTPSHHRVHHGRNPKYLDRNYAGALILWDRLFGTFQKEEEEPVYGIVKPLGSWNAAWANWHVWQEILAEARTASGFAEKLRCFFRPPEGRSAARGGPPAPIVPVAHSLSSPKYATFEHPIGVTIGFLLLLPLASRFFARAGDLSPLPRVALGLGILLAVVGLGRLAEKKSPSKI